jgi:hypothetical protein
VNWLFRNRRTGEITVAQRPNAPLAIWLVATIVGLAFDPTGGFGTALTIVGRGALIVWAADELLRGVNPFRRILGAVVLAATIASIVT